MKRAAYRSAASDKRHGLAAALGVMLCVKPCLQHIVISKKFPAVFVNVSSKLVEA